MNISKVILNYPKEIETTVFAKLEKISVVKIVGILNWEESQIPSRFEQFSDAQIFPGWDTLHKGVSGNFSGVDLRLLTPAVLEALRWSEPITLDMMNRVDPNKNMTYLERTNLYQYLVCYWLGILNELKPDVFYTRYAPHEVIDFVLFAVCKYLDIKVILFNYTVLPQTLIVADDFRHPWNVLTKKASPGEMQSRWNTSQVESYISNIKGLYQNAIPADSLEAFNTNSITKKSIKFKLLNIYLVARKKIGIVLYGLRYITTAFKSWNSSKALLEKLLSNIHNRIVSEDFKRLPAYYDKIAQKLELSTPYIYFPLNFQPELTSSPLGGIFADQVLAISLVSASLPKGWLLYVKEHPAQFLDVNFYGYVSRDESFYNKLLSIPNVRLIARDTDQFEIIDRSECVATITGTAGWQAIVRGKKTIVLGEAWYQNAPNVFRVKDNQDCLNAINTISTNTNYSEVELIKFLHTFINQSVDIIFDEEGAKYMNKKLDFESSCQQLYEILSYVFEHSKSNS